jgi:hypothetical protein
MNVVAARSGFAQLNDFARSKKNPTSDRFSFRRISSRKNLKDSGRKTSEEAERSSSKTNSSRKSLKG